MVTRTKLVMTSRDHPAKWNRDVLRLVQMWLSSERRRLGRVLDVLDPFAGVGRIHDLPKRIAITTGVELESEWANARAGTIVGDATAMPQEWSDRFDAIATSVVFGNRMSDHHAAKDDCYECKGTGVDLGTTCGAAPWLCPTCQRVDCECGLLPAALKEHNTTCPTCAPHRCKACGGNGLTRRHTYRHSLGRELHPNNAGRMQFQPGGGAYVDLHVAFYAEATRVVRRRGLLLVDVKDFYRDHKLVRVSDWHAKTIKDAGFVLEALQDVEVRGTRHGHNHDSRSQFERLIIARKR